MLYLVATPIGNLADFSTRAVATLSQCDYILCEDTRHSKILLDHYNIKGVPLKSFHCFNEKERENHVITDLKEGKNIALISDAGSPSIADPGECLVAKCHDENIPIRILPGPSACTAAVILSGFSTQRFQFMGFVPKKHEERKEFLLDALLYPYTSVCYETPHRILDTLEMLATLQPTRLACLARELTKVHEEIIRRSAQDLWNYCKACPPRGEMALVIAGAPNKDQELSLSPQEHVELLQTAYALSKKEAIQLAATLRNTSRRSLYQTLLNEQ